ncbi:16S rRNA (cytosine(967)-C(5))-methyltransferase RsmB [Marinimicrobium sp. ABcell2]|uniref:16S rRNA (cytosine(967)-C(5))-methyltransferase RsmB n=1 Tax=Marinimicrobium sp. ABcell2 TaxID=3069751 RepID=UPI0027B142FD|nr:16S rRNA (cytosine(967)-C(5))-methyltransferase RsmB [Marinimicrobium sp. ABcell2]MDQ2077066.1 16S rRNA (cytosine(967)-C(5))-methyltransferase RsmB [Marinimicrobium sp. ABcell2]
MKVRTAAAQVVGRVLRHQGSLSSLLPDVQSKVPERDRPLLQELCYGCLRWQPQLDLYLQRLLDKPLRAKDSDIQALLLLGLYQLIYTRIPDHAAISDTVESARALKKPWATRLANGVLRRFQRERETLDEQLQNDPVFSSAHPRWLLDALGAAWPEHTPGIIQANNTHPPLTLRLNPRLQSRDDYLATLAELDIDARATPHSPVGIQLARPCDPTTLPLFKEGGISVQDEAAQLAAPLLELAAGQRVLDACCAPGGKTGHILEAEPDLAEVVALDADPRRLTRVEENLARLQVQAQIVSGDAAEPGTWWDGELFDRILLDAPCSATGIIRRHPDIKYLRSPGEIAKLAQLQARLLDSLWALLKPGGVMVYATCSVMPAENREQIEAFLTRQKDASCDTLTASWGMAQSVGRQLLPDADGHDGFYYARVRKS